MRSVIVFVLSAMAICLTLATGVQASPTELQGFRNGIRVDVPRDRIDGRIGDLSSTTPDGGVFADATNAPGDPTGTQIFVNIGTTTANGSSTGNINTATAFMLGNLVSTADNTGVFSGMTTQLLGSVSFNSTSPTSLDFGNSVFGKFASTSITPEPSSPGFVNIVVLGEWTPGTYGDVAGGPFTSLLKISLTQTPALSGSISASASFATPAPSTVPEPSSFVLVLSGLVAGVVMYGFRRGWRGLVVAELE